MLIFRFLRISTRISSDMFNAFVISYNGKTVSRAAYQIVSVNACPAMSISCLIFGEIFNSMFISQFIYLLTSENFNNVLVVSIIAK